MSDQQRVTVVRHERGKRVDQAELPVGTRQQQHAAVGVDPTAPRLRRGRLSNAAVIFLPPRPGSEKGRGGAASLVAMADFVPASRVGRPPIPMRFQRLVQALFANPCHAVNTMG